MPAPRHAAQVLGAVLLGAVSACTRGAPKPDAIRPAEDACAFCRMQISQPRFAAEILTPEGTYAKFDDLGCFRAHRAAHADLAAAPAWVVDYETGGWIEAQRAVYAGGAREPTPMASGLVATSSRERAAALGTDVLSYEQMLAAGSASRHP